MQKVEDVSDLIIGEYYLVAHVNIKNEHHGIIDIDVQIIPIWHNDSKDFGIKTSHYHIDGRFVANTSNVARYFRVTDGMTATLVSNELSLGKTQEMSEIFYKKKKCIRVETGVPGVKFHKPAFFEKYKGKSCKGKKCPHWGAKMTNIDGVLVCPMHGLRGCLETEIIL